MMKMKSDLLKVKDEILGFKEIMIVSHVDADGMTSAGITKMAFERLGIPASVHVIRQLDRQRVEEILDLSTENIIFTDLGSGQIANMGAIFDSRKVIIVDHHVPCGSTHNNLLFHLNSHVYGVDGSREVSGSGLTYLFSRFISGGNQDLSPLAIVGAVGDMQTREGLSGLNKFIFDEGRGKFIDSMKDIAYFGKQTRPVYKMLSFASDPYLPGISGNEAAANAFVGGLIEQVNNETNCWKYWVDLSIDDKQKITTALISDLLLRGYDTRIVTRLITDSYILLNEIERTEMRDAMEYSTLLNACGRHDCAAIGLDVVLGDRGKSLSSARTFLQEHRNQLAQGIKLLKESGVECMKNVQVFKTNRIKSTIIGIVIGMAIGARIIDHRMPVVAVSDDVDPGFCKVSCRGTMPLVHRGLRLNRAMALSLRVGGEGGGHDIAAGAKVRKEKLDEFLNIVDEEIGRQMKSP
ncbi:MAG: DHH family phosphoesterase [archaeon]